MSVAVSSVESKKNSPLGSSMNPVKVNLLFNSPARREMTIEEFTTVDPVTVSPDTKVDDVVALFREYGFRHLPVVENNRVVGIISDRDILLARPMGVTGVITAKEVMTKDPYSVRIDASLEEIALELSSRKFSSVMVYGMDDKFCGIFTATDALNALVEVLRGQFDGR